MKYLINQDWNIISSSGKTYKGNSPCTVLSVLLDNHVIENPYYRDNEKNARQFLYENYSFINNFHLSEEDLNRNNYLCFDRLCTIADIYVNDIKIDEARDMHQRYKYKLDNKILRKDNELRIEFKSPYKYIEEYPVHDHLFETYAVTNKKSPVIRQANYMFGWDWGPSLADMGIVGDVYLLSTSIGYLKSFRHYYQHVDNKYKVFVSLELIDCKAKVEVSLSGHGVNLSKQYQSQELCFEIDNPALWYPVGFGEQNLYDLKISLGNEQEYQYKIGLRDIKIDDSLDEYGRNFAIYVNGIKVFLKGSDYIPEDNILPLTNKERTRRLLTLAKDFNHNCIRVWGGGYYPDDYFYEICDELGLLVFQDLMFACASYDIDDQNFRKLVIEETIDSLKRIRHHASIFIIAGNNEVEDGVRGHGFKQAQQYLEMFHHILKDIVNQETDFYYLTSSPTSGDPYFASPNDTNFLDTHYWWVWGNDRDVEDYLNIQPRLLSEFGLQSFSTIDTTMTYAKEEDLSLTSKVMLAHQKMAVKSYDKLINYVKRQFKVNNDFRRFTYLSMLMQAEGIKLCADHLRSHKERCNGVLYWQLNDCWPVQAWSSIDYEFGLKALHYYSKKFYAPHLVSVEKNNDKLAIYVSNDTDKKQKYVLRYMFIDQKFDLMDAKEENIEVDKSSSKLVTELDNDSEYYALVVELYGGHSLLSRNIYRNKKDKDVNYPKVNVSIKKLGKCQYEISTDNFVRGLYLNPHNNKVVFSDNYFDILKEETIVISSNIDIDIKDIELMSINND